MQFTTSALLALAGMASAQTLHVVSVSGEGEWALKFSPDNLKAAAGDMIQFQFRAGNHSVVQSNFDNPCTPISQHTNATGFFSGYQLVAASEAMGMIPTYTIMVADAKPMWVYCSQGKHCQAGMSMVINENPTANSSRTLDAYKQLSSSVPASSAGGSTSGGNAGSVSGGSGSGSGTGTSGGDATTTGTTDGTTSSTSSPVQAAANMVSVASYMSMLALAAAFFVL